MKMFSGWCRENFFGHMMEHYDIDGLVEYGSEVLPAHQWSPMAKILTDTVKMIAYRSETALVGLLRNHLKKEEDRKIKRYYDI